MLVLTGLISVSCLRDRVEETRPVPKTKGEFTLKLSLEGMGAEAATRTTVPPTAGEEDIQDLYLLFFEPGANGSGMFVDAVIPMAPYRMNEDISFSFDNTTLEETEEYNILIIGNGGQGYFVAASMDEWVTYLVGKTETEVYDTARATVSGAQNDSSGDNTHAIASDKILMTGRAAYTPGISVVTSVMTRALVRYDVINTVSQNFTLSTTSIWNAFPNASVFGGGMVDYSTNVARLGRYYGVQSVGGADIVGGLYSFENKVAVPAATDGATTCLIVGIFPTADVPYYDENNTLQNWDAGVIKYYRVNINSIGGSQSLKRNNAYKLTIRGVTGPGYDTEGEAYLGTTNSLIYVINYWDLDDDGLVVYDGTHLLSIPTKTASLSPAGETRELSIFTFGEGVLAIRNQSFTGNGAISASLNGNTLVINAQPLGIGETERTGFVELAFAGLTATINVVQDSSGDKYLNVTTPVASGIPPFESSARYPSGIITIQASGSWTASIHQDGFSFSSVGDQFLLTSADVPGGQFQIYTTSVNQSINPLEAFVLIKLDEDPDNFNAALLLTQKATGTISVSPAGNILVFNADTSLDTSGADYMQQQDFSVTPSDDGGVIHNWDVQLVRFSPASQDDTGRFEIYDVQKSASNPDGNKFSIRPVGRNMEARDYRAKVKVLLYDSPTVYVEFEVAQRAFDLANNAVAEVAVNGGMSDVINFTTTMGGIQWKLVSVDTYTTTTPLVLNHHAALVYNAAGTNILTADNTAHEMTEGIRVAFPKVYYPNRDKVIRANVTLGIVATGSPDVILTTYVVTVGQNPLTARTLIAGSMYSSYGSINASATNTYFNYFRYMLTNTSVFGAGRPVPFGPFALPTSNITTGAISDNINYLNANSHDGGNYTTAQFQNINTWRQNDGVVLFTTANWFFTNTLFTNNSSIFVTLGITQNGALDDDINARTLNTGNTNSTRIGQFVTTNGVFPFIPGTMNLYVADDYSTAANISAMTTASRAVALIGLNNNKVGLFIDPANRIVFIGDGDFMDEKSQTAYSSALTPNATPANDYDKFLANLVAYLAYTAAYGSHFSDLLIDDFTLPAPWSTPLPAPWDSSWTTP